MQIDQIQAILQKMPDQQLQRLAATGSPEIPPVLIEMELSRRATLRKNQVLDNQAAGGIQGFAEGGLAEKKWYQFGPRVTMPEDNFSYSGGQTDGGLDQVSIDSPLSQSIEALRQRRIDALNDKNKSDFRRTEIRDSNIRDAMPSAQVMQGGTMPTPDNAPTATPKTQYPDALQGIAQLANRTSEANMQGVNDGVAIADMQAEERVKKAAEVYKQIQDAKEANLIKPDEADDAKRAFFRGLAQFGSQLALTGRIGNAGVAGLQAWTEQMDKDEAAKKAFKQEAGKLAVSKLEDQLALMGYSDAQRAQLRKEFFDTMGLKLNMETAARADRGIQLQALDLLQRAPLIGAQAEQASAQAASLRSGGKNQYTREDAIRDVQKHLASGAAGSDIAAMRRGELTMNDLVERYMQLGSGAVGGASGSPPALAQYGGSMKLDPKNQAVLDAINAGKVPQMPPRSAIDAEILRRQQEQR